MSLRAQNSEKEAKMLNKQLEDLKKQLDEVMLLIHMIIMLIICSTPLPAARALIRCLNSCLLVLVLHFGTPDILINI